MKQSDHAKVVAAVLVAISSGGVFSLSAAHADNQTSEMRDLVRQSQGLKPSDGTAEKKKFEAPKNIDPAAIYVEAGVNAEQATKIREMRKNFDKVAQLKSAEAVELFKEMHDLTVQAELDEPKIIAAQTKINALQADMAMEKTKTLINIRKILTPKQRENLVVIIRKRSATQAQQPH